ncbi:unnamed protein product [Protopolystoma xenopodis]|uniref:Uncharacterized protein n=1 Tax=Protopolystoma xenopodis TaxID=117903 RepID=A0A3S5CV90_9PLAT|nr:unnamed protein product [Protopolystoma xenopodis]
MASIAGLHFGRTPACCTISPCLDTGHVGALPLPPPRPVRLSVCLRDRSQSGGSASSSLHPLALPFAAAIATSHSRSTHTPHHSTARHVAQRLRPHVGRAGPGWAGLGWAGLG